MLDVVVVVAAAADAFVVVDNKLCDCNVVVPDAVVAGAVAVVVEH